MRKGLTATITQQPKADKEVNIKPVSCVGCCYLKDVGKGTGFCSHIRVRMLSPIANLKKCIYRTNATQ